MMTDQEERIQLQSWQDSQARKRHADDITEKLTYFVISVQLIFCGYVLLNARELAGFPAARYLFVFFGFAAAFGIIWRFLYNIVKDGNAYGHKLTSFKIANFMIKTIYPLYLLTTILSFFALIVTGYFYLANVKIS